MPWTKTSALQERIRFVKGYQSGLYPMTELCARFGVSRQTGYEWLGRYLEQGAVGLEDRSRAPRHCPHRMSRAAERAIVAARRRHPTWGPRKLLAWLADRHPELELPSPGRAAAKTRATG
jgi:putative transposase